MSQGGQVSGSSLGNSGLVNGDNSTIGVSDQAVESRGVSSSIDGGGSSSSVDTSNNSLGGQMIGTGGSNSTTQANRLYFEFRIDQQLADPLALVGSITNE